ncbi:coiled-coil domain-containing protein 93 isoform X3 [Festucalex cinctus]
MAATVSVFNRARRGSRSNSQLDQGVNVIQGDDWEDEEQCIKLAEILELLLAAGYFRARIKGLSPFDKVVGGMTWCITTCNYDIDIDLLFQENSTIGQKMRYGFSKLSKQEKSGEEMALTMKDSVTQVSDEEVQWVTEEGRIKSLMNTMAAMVNDEGQLTASAVGFIVGQQSEEIKLIASEYAEKNLEVSEDLSEWYGPLHQHVRAVASLNKQIQQMTNQCAELQAKHTDVKKDCKQAKNELIEVTEKTDTLMNEVMALEDVEGQANISMMEKLRALVTLNENLKLQEQAFRTHCRDEMIRLQQSIENFRTVSGLGTEEEKQRNQLIDIQHNADREKLQNVRLLMARRNRDIAILQRTIDEVPCRAELTQYQKRFVELYCQVSATHKETKQFFTLYNTLDDKKVYLEKEVNLLNSIHDNFQQAMSSSAAKEQFLRQMEQIVDGIRQSRIKMEKKKQENKMRRDQLNDKYLELLDIQRLYFKTVKDFKEECRKNEMLLSKLRAKGASW